jgi:hypothetical protein
MIVEISGRQTGKTTRLITRMYNFISDNHNNVSVGLISPNMGNTLEIRNRLISFAFEMTKVKEFLNHLSDDYLLEQARILINNHVVVSTQMDNPLIDYWFVDEFCFINSDKLLIPKETEFTYRLINHCGMRNTPIRHVPMRDNYRATLIEWGEIGEVQYYDQIMRHIGSIINLNSLSPNMRIKKHKM